MKNKKYKILVLSDLKKSTSTTLTSTVSLAKMINGDIAFFYAKKATDLIEKDNQFSAIRTINQEYNTTEKKIQKLIKTISKEFGININHTFSFGNVKNEIGKYIEEHKPDIIVLGKRKSKQVNFIGDNVTDFVLKKHDGIIMIASDENTLEPNQKLSLGVLHGMDQPFNMEFVKNLIGHTEKPIKSFSIVKNSNVLKKADVSESIKTVEYVFEYNDNAVKNLSNYLSKNDINLLCVDRWEKDSKNKATLVKSNIKEVINTLNVSLLLTGN